MEENNNSINDEKLGAISAGGAPSFQPDFASISFDEYLAMLNFPDKKGFPPAAYDSCISSMKENFERWKEAIQRLKKEQS